MDPNRIFELFSAPHQKPRHKGGLGLFVYPNMLLACSILILSGCGNNTRTDKSSELDRYVAESGAVLSPDAGGASGGQRAVGGWSIVISSVASGRMEHATALLTAIQNQGGLPGAYIDERTTGLVIAYGRYTGADDPMAKKDLDRIHTMMINDARPYVGAFIAPPSGDSLKGSDPQFDLRNVKARFGDRAVYTLQIGVYGADDLRDPSPEEISEYRRAAEKAVAELREQGEQAFYYHAAMRSMVTVGVFSRDDHDGSVMPPMESSALKETRKKFPNNTLNGMGIRETVRTEQGKAQRIQRSQLVEIPKH